MKVEWCSSIWQNTRSVGSLSSSPKFSAQPMKNIWCGIWHKSIFKVYIMTLKYECENFDTILRSRDYVHVCFDQTDFVANKVILSLSGSFDRFGQQNLVLLGRSLCWGGSSLLCTRFNCPQAAIQGRPCAGERCSWALSSEPCTRVSPYCAFFPSLLAVSIAVNDLGSY